MLIEVRDDSAKEIRDSYTVWRTADVMRHNSRAGVGCRLSCHRWCMAVQLSMLLLVQRAANKSRQEYSLTGTDAT